jgi:hypothetical protein
MGASGCAAMGASAAIFSLWWRPSQRYELLELASLGFAGRVKRFPRRSVPSYGAGKLCDADNDRCSSGWASARRFAPGLRWLCWAFCSTTTRRAKRREVQSSQSSIVFKQIDVSKKASAAI